MIDFKLDFKIDNLRRKPAEELREYLQIYSPALGEWEIRMARFVLGVRALIDGKLISYVDDTSPKLNPFDLPAFTFKEFVTFSPETLQAMRDRQDDLRLSQEQFMDVDIILFAYKTVADSKEKLNGPSPRSVELAFKKTNDHVTSRIWWPRADDTTKLAGLRLAFLMCSLADHYGALIGYTALPFLNSVGIALEANEWALFGGSLSIGVGANYICKKVRGTYWTGKAISATEERILSARWARRVKRRWMQAKIKEALGENGAAERIVDFSPENLRAKPLEKLRPYLANHSSALDPDEISNLRFVYAVRQVIDQNLVRYANEHGPHTNLDLFDLPGFTFEKLVALSPDTLQAIWGRQDDLRLNQDQLMHIRTIFDVYKAAETVRQHTQNSQSSDVLPDSPSIESQFKTIQKKITQQANQLVAKDKRKLLSLRSDFFMTRFIGYVGLLTPCLTEPLLNLAEPLLTHIGIPSEIFRNNLSWNRAAIVGGVGLMTHAIIAPRTCRIAKEIGAREAHIKAIEAATKDKNLWITGVICKVQSEVTARKGEAENPPSPIQYPRKGPPSADHAT